jgi:integrase
VRPGELQALTWNDVGERTVLVERAADDAGRIMPTKTGQTRSARLMAPVRADLAEWRLACGRPDDDALLFPAPDGGARTESRWRNWRSRTYRPAYQGLGIASQRPYDLRHSAASLWLHEGRSVVEVASWLGHSPQMTLSTYAHVMADLDGERRDAETEIRAARDELVRPVTSRALGLDRHTPGFGFTRESPLSDSNR